MSSRKYVKLSTDEKVIRNYNYSKTRGRQGVKKDNLIITNKRVIIEKNEPTGMNRIEIPIEFIDSVETTYRKLHRSNIIAFIFIIAGLILAYAAYKDYVWIPNIENYTSVIYIISGFIALIGVALLFRAPYASISLLFQTYTGVPSAIGVLSANSGTWTSKNGNKVQQRKNARRLDITVNRNAFVMVNEIGAIIMNVKKKYYQN